MVLPPDPCSSTGPCMTPSATDTTGDDFEFGFGGVAATGDMGKVASLLVVVMKLFLDTSNFSPPFLPPFLSLSAFPMDIGLMGDLNSELSTIDLGEEFHNAPLGMGQGVEDTLPKATGYLISSSPPGDLPDEFWGHDKPQTLCSMFKVRFIS